MRPLNDYVVVQKYKNEQKESPIYVPESVREEQPIGKVVAIGPGKPLDQISNCEIDRLPMTVTKGDIVLFYEAASQKIILKGNEYYVMTETNIFLILNSEDLNGE